MDADGQSPGLRERASTAPRWLALCIGVVAIFLTLGLLGELFGGGPSGPVSSSYATNSQGLAAWAELLSRTGHTVVQLRTPLQHARLDPADTVVVLDPEALLATEGKRLLAFVDEGGRLVIGGSSSQSTLPAVIPRPPQFSGSGTAGELAAADGGATVAGVSEVRSAGEGEWRPTAGYSAPLGSATGGSLLLERDLGSGKIELLADASPLQNRLLGTADNAQLALNLAGGHTRAVVFAEAVHGFGHSIGLAALPSHWRLTFAGLALAGLLWILARGRRLGPPEQAGIASAAPRSAYVEAISLLLRRTRDPQELSAVLTRLRDRR
jgi:Domain of unknown function (DUF4350)